MPNRARPSKTARGQREKQAGRREGTCDYGDRVGTCCGLDHPARSMAGTGSLGKKGSREDNMGQRRGGVNRRYHQGRDEQRVGTEVAAEQQKKGGGG